MYGNLDIEIVDFIDLIDNTLSKKFTEKWKHKYSEKFIKLFQLKILTALSNRKPIKIDSLYNYFTKKGRYSPEVVINFFDSIEVELFHPVITGKLTKGPKTS